MAFFKYFRAGLQEWFPGLQGLEGRARRLRIRSEWIALGLLFVLAAGYSVFVGTLISRAYIDIGDGNYLYTSSRIADGLTIYRDFLSPQPPLHLLVGSLLVRFGRMLGPDEAPLYTVRVFSLLLHLATMLLIYALGRRVTQTPWGGLLAAALYLLFPTGLWWSLGYQSELLEIFFLMLSLLCFIQLRPAPMTVAGVAAALSVLTNMTAAPYALASVAYLVLRHGLYGGWHVRRGRDAGVPRPGWRLVWAYAVPLAAVWGGVAAYYQIRTGAFFLNVIGNQVASYPRGDFWAYATSKVVGQTAKILEHEGGLILFGVLGLILHNRNDMRPEREYLVWYSLALVLSFLYVTKGGTMDYIFTIGEPILAVFGALFLTHFFYPSTFRRFRVSPLRDTSALAQAAFLLLLLAGALALPIQFLGQVRRENQFEQGLAGLDRVVYQIQAHSRRGAAILSDPYYAFVTHRRLAGEFSELYLWCLKYSLECQAMQIAEGDLTDPAGLLRAIGAGSDAPSRAIRDACRPEARAVFERFAKLEPGARPQRMEALALGRQLNDLMTSTTLTQSLRAAGLDLPAGLEPAASLLRPEAGGADLLRVNRLLLEAAYPAAIRPNAEARRPDGEGVAKVKAIAAQLCERAVPVAVLSVENPMLMRAPEIRGAIERYYQPLTAAKDPNYRTQSFQLQVFVPKTATEMAP